MPKICTPAQEMEDSWVKREFQEMLISFLSFPISPSSLLALKMQELEQRVIEAEQRAEDAEKQVRDSLLFAPVQAKQELTLNSPQSSIQTARCSAVLCSARETLIFSGEWIFWSPSQSFSLSYG